MTSELRLDQFPEFFEQVTGHEPFLWQMNLVERLLDGGPPEVIDVPTGFGKTSVLHCWAYALAAGGSVPRRLCFVVDRRVVVDATYGDAEDLVEALAQPDSDIVDEVAGRLRALHGDPSFGALKAVRMRGGVTWDSRWLARPDQAAIVVGTVDQFGSRLLMRGYGVSNGMRPINAALVGLDTWLVVDEAHIAEPLVRTTDSVVRYQGLSAQLGDVPSLRVTQMSATLSGAQDSLRADTDAEAGSATYPCAAQAARDRLSADKRAALVDLTDLDKAGPKRKRASTIKFGTALADIAMQIDEDAGVVGVIANTITAARAAYERLNAAGEEACLLIGRTRGYERDRVADEWLRKIKVGRAPLPDGERLFVVATQTIEVGANIDLDALVTECAPLSALIQRFGRVNRIGERDARRCAIIHAGFAHDANEDKVYGAATSATWDFLQDQGGPPAELTTKTVRREIEWAGETVDFGLEATRRLAASAGDDVRVEQPFVPQIIGAHLERWANTNPAPLRDQSVDPFLHGVERDFPQVSVAWRAIPTTEEPSALARWRQWLDLVRPVEWEFVDVPVWEMHAFLRGETSQLPTADLDWSLVEPDEEADAERSEELLGVVYRSTDDSLTPIYGPDDVSSGDRVVLRCDLGGHDRWGWTGLRREEDDPWVPDVADLAPTRRPPDVRLVESVVASFVPWSRLDEVHDAFDPLRDVAETWRSTADAGPPGTAELRDAVQAVVTRLRDRGLLEWVPSIAARLDDELSRPKPIVIRDLARDVPSALPGVWIPVRSGEPVQVSPDAVSDEDMVRTSAAGNQQSLNEHGDEVGAMARRFAENLGLSDGLRQAVEAAGRWHDLGKADPRFQVMLHDGDSLAAEAAADPLAKSGRDSRDPIGTRARQVSGLPQGFRHEAVSGLLVHELTRVRPDAFARMDADLVHHLVVSHHGHARPLLRPVLEPEPQKVAVRVGDHQVAVETANQIDWDHPARFEALNQQYGWWGLALLETLVRLADMRCSEVQR